MSKRYYVCDIIGNGTEENPYRPAVADYGVSWVGSIPTNEQGHPVFAWSLVLVASKEHASLRGDNRIDPLPDFPLDGRMNAINQAASAALSAALLKRSIAVSYGGTDGYRDVIRAIGRKLEPTFNENNFDVAEA